MSSAADATAAGRATGRRRAPRVLLDLLPAVLAALAEGAWIAVPAALVAAAAHEGAPLVVPGAVAAALVGLAAARILGARPDWPIVTVWLTFAAALVGWLVDASTIEALARLDAPAALGSHLAGWFAGLAFLRGSAHARATSSEGAMETLIGIALPALALPLLVGGVLADPWRTRFLDDSRPAVILFLASATIGVGVARLAALRGTGGFDWRGNRAWLALIVLLVVAVSLLALPIAAVLGPLVQLLVAVLLLPVLVLGTIAGFRHVSRWAVAAYVLLWIALITILSVVNNTPTPETGETPTGAVGPQEATNSAVTAAALGIVALALIALAIFVLARLWSRDVLSRSGGDVPEERWIDTSEPVAAMRPRRHRAGSGRRHTPTTAEEAYLAALEALDRSPHTRREPGESPAAHAARLRSTVGGAPADSGGPPRRPPGLALDLLAADYELARFGGVPLSAAELRRAIGRWRRVRDAR
jgi:hypothetical protein